MGNANALNPAVASSMFYGEQGSVASAPAPVVRPSRPSTNPRLPHDNELECWMERYANGSAEAFEEVYRLTAPKVYSYLLRLCRQREKAEDLLQVTYSKVHRARTSYLSGAPPLPWMLAIARRTFYDDRRAQKSRTEDLSNDGDLPEPVSDINPVPVDTAAALEKAMDRIPEAYREAIELTKVAGLSVSEAAELLGTTPAAIKLRVHRGYGMLRKSLEAYDRRTPT